MLKYDLNLREYWRIIKRRKLIILFTVVVMAIFSFVSAILGKPVPIFKTYSTVKVEKSVSYIGMNTVQSLGGTNAMETQTYVIKSYYVLELTAKKMGLIPADLSPEEVRQNSTYINIISDLQGRIHTEQRGNSDLIDITVTANEPAFATNFCNTLTEVYKTQHTLDLNRRTIEGKKFIESQFSISKDKLSRSEEAVRRFREINKWTSLEGESTFLSGQINRLQALYEQDHLVSQKVTAASRLLDEARHRPLTSELTFYFDEATPPYKALNERLVSLLLERDTLLITYTDDFPQIKAIKNQIYENIESMKSHLRVQQRNLLSNLKIYKQQLADLNDKFKRLPEKALELTRLDRDVGVAKEVYYLLEKKYQEAQIAEAEKLEEVKIVKPAILPESPVNPPKVGTNTILGTMLGLILGVVFAFLIETFDTSIGAIEEVEDFLGVHVMGVIPFVSVEEIKTLLSDEPSIDLEDDDKIRRYARLAAHFVPSSTLSESYKALRTSLNFLCTENNLKSVLFTSSSPGEGKTSIVVNVAITMAQIGQKVLLIDGDLRRPVVSKLFGLEQTPGLTDVILGNHEWHNVVRTITDLMMGRLSIEDIMRTPGMDNLHIMTSGTYSPNPAEIINSRSIGDFLNSAREEYDIILVDAPPVLAATDAALWSSRVDATVMVYQVGKVARGALKRSKTSLENIKAHVVGVVLNGLKAEISPDFGYQDYYYYYYGKEKTPPTLARRIKDKVLSGPRNLLSSLKGLFGEKSGTRQSDEDSERMEAPSLEKIPDIPKEDEPEASHPKTMAAEANGKRASGSSSTRRHKQIRRPKNGPPKRTWLKILTAILLLILLGAGILYQLGYLMDSRKAASRAENERPSTPPVPVPPAAPSNPAPPPAAPLPGAPPLPTPPAGMEQPKEQAGTASPEPVREEATQGKTPSGSQGSYAIQIQSAPTVEEANRIVSALKARGEDAYTARTTVKGGGTWYRVYIGRFASNNEAMYLYKQREFDKRYPGSIVQYVPRHGEAS